MKIKFIKLTFLVCLIIFIHSMNKLAAQTGTGFDYMPSQVDVTGGGNMPDTINGYRCDCDGTGKTDATACLQAALNTAYSQGKPLLIPYTPEYYKISGQLTVKGSVMGIGGMPTIKQTTDNVALRLGNNMTGWIYNLHIVGTYAGSGLSSNEFAHNISLGGVNGVTISHNLLELPKGDCVTDNAQEQDANVCRNVLVTNNSMINPWRCNISFNNITDRWAILNNYLTYTTSYVDPIDLEPWRPVSFVTNVEIAYNNINSPKPPKNDATHFYQAIVALAGWFDPTPGGNVYTHHNFGTWGAPIIHPTGYQGAPSTWTNIVTTNNIQGNTPPPSSDVQAPDIPTGLKAAVSDKAIDLSWKASVDNVAVTGYEVFKNGISVGKTLGTSLKISGLSCSTAYSMTVKARDAVMNWSNASAALIVTTPYCPGSDSIVTFENRPATETALTGKYANVNWGSSGWATYPETKLNPASTVLKMTSNATSEQTDTIIVLSGNTLKGIDVAVPGNPATKKIIISSGGNPDCIWTDMVSTFSNYQTNWKIAADTIIVKITCDAGASAVFMDNLVFGDTQAPTSPTGLSSSEISFTSATLSWKSSIDNIAVADYEVFENGVSIGTTTGTFLKINGLICNAEYSFTVKAKDLSGNRSSLSEPFNITTSVCDIIAPEIVQNLIAGNVTATSFTLSWSPSSDNDGIAGYEVYKDDIKYGSTTTETSMNIIGLSQSTACIMTVKAKDFSGNLSGVSDALIVTTGKCELPFGWTGADIGVTSGQSSCESNGVFTVEGAGADIWETADQFRFVYKSITGDGVIIAKVESIENTWAWAKSGVMIRESLSPDSKQVDCIVTPLNGIGFQNRPTTAGVSTVLGSISGVNAPYWVKLERIGDTFNAYASPDGIAWTQVGKSSKISMTANVYFGLAVTSHLADVGCTSVLSNVGTTGILTGIPEKLAADLSSGVILYPNPLTGQTLKIEGVEGAESISLFAMTGRLVFSQKLQKAENQTVNFSKKLMEGSYLVKITGRKGAVSKLLMVQ